MSPQYPDKPVKKPYKGDVKHVAGVIGGAISPLMRQVRKFAAMKACLGLLPEELSGLAAPYDVRLAPPEGESARGGDYGGLNTMFIYVANQTVAQVLRQRSRQLTRQINDSLPVEYVEALRFEEAPAAKIARQVNILNAEPD